MKNQLSKLGIFINPHKIIKNFDENGANNGISVSRAENLNKLFLLKKGSKVKPVKDFTSPSKDDGVYVSLAYNFINKLDKLASATDPVRIQKLVASIKSGRFKPLNYTNLPDTPENAKILSDRVKLDYKKFSDFYEKKRVFEQSSKEYDGYTSEQYIKTSLAYKLSRKIEVLLGLMGKNKEESDPKAKETRTVAINKLLSDLQGGISKPVFNKGGERQYVMKFSDLYPIPTDEGGLVNLLSTVKSEFKNDMELFVKKNELKQVSLKFSPAIHATVTYVVQETVKNLLELAAKNCKANQKLSLSIENLSHDVIKHSLFYPLIYNLDCVRVLDEYVKRREKYNEETKTLKSSRNKYMKIVSFYDMEKKNNFMKEEKNRKIWKGLNTENDEFASTVAKIFETIKKDLKVKIRLSDRTKEFLSLLVSQMLEVMSERFNIHRKHKVKIDPLIKKSNKVRPEEKSIKFETVVEIFEMVFCPKTKESVAFIETICQFKSKLKKTN